VAHSETPEIIDRRDQDTLERRRLVGQGSGVTVRVLLDRQLGDGWAASRMIEDHARLVNLISSPGPPQPQYVRLVEVGYPPDFHVEESQSVTEQLDSVRVQDELWSPDNKVHVQPWVHLGRTLLGEQRA
jgi:hypothetical protein